MIRYRLEQVISFGTEDWGVNSSSINKIMIWLTQIISAVVCVFCLHNIMKVTVYLVCLLYLGFHLFLTLAHTILPFLCPEWQWIAWTLFEAILSKSALCLLRSIHMEIIQKYRTYREYTICPIFTCRKICFYKGHIAHMRWRRVIYKYCRII